MSLKALSGVRIEVYENEASLNNSTTLYDIKELRFPHKEEGNNKAHAISAPILRGIGKSCFFRDLFFQKNREEHFQIFELKSGKLILCIQRPFKLCDQRYDILDSNKERIGVIQKHFSLFHSRIQLLDKNEREIYRIICPKTKDWEKLKIEREEKNKIGCIKKHNHLDRKFIDIHFPCDEDETGRYLIIAASLCIDILCGEDIPATDDIFVK